MTAVAESLAARIDTSAGANGCHPWTGARSARGYGLVRIDGACAYVHRLVLTASLGRELVDGENALHHCDNPPCCNAAHLYAGSQQQNVRDAVERGRADLSGLEMGRAPGKLLGHWRTGSELCGTVRGYSRHLRHGERTCMRCRAARNAYNRARKALAS